MRVIIAGSRCVNHLRNVEVAMDKSGLKPTLVVSGTARGADVLGEQWAAQNGIAVARYPADWNAHGKSAGYLRNTLMADNADALVAIWDGRSHGTKHMIDIATRKKLLVFVYPFVPAPPLCEKS